MPGLDCKDYYNILCKTISCATSQVMDDKEFTGCGLICDGELKDPLQQVFSFLSLKDLSSLSQVCRKFFYDIEIYCRACWKQLPFEALDQVFKKELTLESDLELRNELQNENEFSFLRSYAMFTKMVGTRRITAIQCVDLGDEMTPRYIIGEYDETLKRDVLTLKINIRCDFSIVFPQINPGLYKLCARIDFQHLTDGTTIKVQWKNSNEDCEEKTCIHSEKWRILTESENYDNYVGSSFELSPGWMVKNFDLSQGWFDVCLMKMQISSLSDVMVEFSNHDQKWKEGMRWDYMELVPHFQNEQNVTA